MATLAHEPDRRKATYDGDYAAWVDAQIDLLANGQLAEIDAANIAEELGDLGASFHRSLISAITQVLIHLAKWDYQVERRSRGWTNSIAVQRSHIDRELARSPSLKAKLNEAVATAWTDARRFASSQTDLPLKTFPVDCPYSWDEIMSRPIRWADEE